MTRPRPAQGTRKGHLSLGGFWKRADLACHSERREKFCVLPDGILRGAQNDMSHFPCSIPKPPVKGRGTPTMDNRAADAVPRPW